MELYLFYKEGGLLGFIVWYKSGALKSILEVGFPIANLVLRVSSGKFHPEWV